MRELGKYLIAKPRNAGIIAFLCTLLPLIYLPGDFISGIIVALVTLARGAKAGLIVLAWVAIPAVSLLYFKQLGEYDIVFLRAVLTWVLSVFLIRQRSWRAVFELSAALGVLAILGVHLWMPNMQNFWIMHLRPMMDEAIKAYKLDVTKEQIELIVQRLSMIATGSITLVFFLACIVQVALGRYWQFSIHAHRTLLEEFSQIRFGFWAILILVAVILGILFKFPLMIDILPLVLLPFLGAGLAVMHLFAKNSRGISVLLALIYVCFILLPVISVLALAGVGLVDSLFNIRGKAA